MIDSFSGKNRWLSNFWLSNVVFDGLVYPSTENAYHAAKTLDKEERRKFLNISPGSAKSLGRKVVLRADWDSFRLLVMKEITAQKFMKGSFLAEKLIATGNQELVEGNNWNDIFWGKCNGFGQNHLGRILMERRDFLND